ncbi:MAG: virulence RhuM family protein [Clostridia bacterium]|nr:virulence RhuM family protein [Clostridia bacterium]
MIYEKNSTVAKFATVQNEGGRNVTREIEYYNLDVIISVGYRVKSQNGIIFRKWATSILNFYGILYKNNLQVIDNNTLTALTLLVAESNPKEKDIIVELIMNFLA